LNSIAGTDFRGRGSETVLTPHPGEMARLLQLPAGAKITDRVATARQFAIDRNVCLVLKGFRTLIALPDGTVFHQIPPDRPRWPRAAPATFSPG